MCESGKEFIWLQVEPVIGSCNDVFMTQKESEDTSVFISQVCHHRAFHMCILMGYMHYVFFYINI